MRIRGAKTELEEAGESTEGMAESTASLREEMLALSGVDIMLNENTFKSTYQIMDELSQKWESLSDIAQASITELVAGKHQGNVMSSLMANFDTARDALNTSLNSSGSAMQEHAKWSESLEARLNKLKATWQSLSQTFMNSDFLKVGIDALTKFVDLLDKLIGSLGSFGTIGLGIGIFEIFKHFKDFKNLKIFGALPSELKSVGDGFKALRYDLGAFMKTSAGVASAIGLVTAAVSLVYNAYKNAKEAAAEARQEVIESSTAYLDAASTFEQAYIKYSGRTDLTADEEAELVSAIQGTVNALGDKSSALQSAVNSSNDYIASLEAIKKAELDAAEKAATDKRDKAAEALKEAAIGWESFDGSEVDIQFGVSGNDEAVKIAKAIGSKYWDETPKGNQLQWVGSFTLDSNADAKDIVEYYNFLKDYQKELETAGLKDTKTYEQVNAAIGKMSETIGIYTDGVYEAVKVNHQLKEGIPKTTEEYIKMREAILTDDELSGFSLDQKMSVLNSLDSEYGRIFNLASVEAQARKFVGIIKGYGDGIGTDEIGTVETFLNMRTAVNNDECTVGQYLAELNNVASMSTEFSDAEKEEFNLAFGIDTDLIKEQYDALKTKLTDEYYGIEMPDNNAKVFLDNLKSRELSAFTELFSSRNKDFNSALQNYKNILNEAEQAGVDFSKTVYGNIDTNARQVLEWNSENLEKYKDELMSWEPEGVSWDNVKKGYEGAISTVMGTLSSYEIDGKEVDIAFSPMLQTDNGAEVLSSGTVDTYINELISKATEDGKWDNAELFALDATGLEVDGQKIKGILADIGETAQATSEQMHFVGKDGALVLAESDIFAMIEHQAKINEALNFKASIEVDTAALETLNTALSESASAIGLTSESITALKSKYKDLESFDAAALFEATANGVKVNQEEVARLEKEHQKLTKSKVKEHLETLVDAYNDNVKAIDECSNASERARLISENETYKSRIEELAQYQAQLEGVTGAYKRWLDAQSTPEDYEGYEAIAKGWESVEDELSRGFLGKASKEYIDLLSGEDLRGADIDAYAAAWGRLDDKVTSTGYSVKDFFTLDDDGNITSTGIHRFFESIKKGYDGVIYKQDEFGNAIYDFSSENLEAIQRDWGIGIEAIGLLLEGAVAAGYNVDWGSILDGIDLDTADFETLVQYAEAAQEAFNKIEGIDNVDFNFTATNVEEATAEIEKARQAFSKFINEDGTVNLEAEGAEEMQFILSTLLMQKQQLSTPAIMKVDTSQIDQAKTDIIEVINAAKNFQTAYENYEIAISTGINVENAETELKNAISALEGTNADIRANLKLPSNEELQSAVNGISDIEVGASLDDTSIGAIEAQIQTQCTPKVIAKVTGLDETAIQNGEGGRQIKYTPEHSEVDAYVNGLEDVNRKIIFTYTTAGTMPNPSNINRTITYTYKIAGTSPAAGTAHVGGTAHASGTTSGKAFARGNWGINGNGVALGGELGQELVVRDGRFFTIGDTGAEFFRYKKNDIIFNAAQTESLFKYGGIKGAKPRGTMLAGGTAFAEGNAFASGIFKSGTTLSGFVNEVKNGIAGIYNKVKNAVVNTYNAAKNHITNNVKVATSSNTKTTSSNVKATASESNFATGSNVKATASESDFSKDNKGNGSSGSRGGGSGGGGSSGGGGGSSSGADVDFYDWIEVLIDRIERAIDRFEKKANNVFDSWENRGDALNKQSDLIRQEIEKQELAYADYLEEAEEVGLAEKYVERIKSGEIKVSNGYAGELKEQIDDYRNFYEKALDCKDAIEELKEKESELYKQRLENVATRYEGILGVIEHEKNMLEEYINQSEEQAWLVSREYYNALADNERENVAELEAQKAEMLNAFSEAMDSGTIAEGSEAYYEMVASIDEVTLAITESHTALLEYEQTLQQLNWEVFDLLQDKISSVTEETEFLIELLSSDKLFDDNGQLTDAGMATMGQHGVAYNTYMHQADLAAAEAARLKAELEKDPYDTELEERYREMISLQQEHILSAQSEKEAIRDLVEEGIGLELEALQELIDKKNEALESERDLYEYQKKVKEQTEEIASLEKQMAAYSGDDSEEAKQKIQQIKVDLESARQDLEETEYDKFIDDSAAMLDELYLEYETTLNTRLDNIDALLEDMIEEINANAVDISNTLSEKADSVGYTLSDSMAEIWDKSSVSTQNVITTYSEKFITAQTTTNNALDSINIKLQDMISKLNEKATANVKSASTSSVAKSTATKSTTTTTTNKSTSGGDGTPKIGDKVKFVDGQYYYDSYGMRPLGSQKQGQYVYITNINNRSGATHPYHISTGTKLGSGDLGWLKLNQITGYATGKRNFSNDEIAWTQEGATEFIVRPSDGAILTPIAKRDSVLNPAASKNIWDMANSPAEFIKNNLNFGSAGVPNSSNVQNNYTQHLEKVVISFPNVKNYDEVLSALRDDKSFEKLVHSMTIDRIAGKSSLAKGKSIR